MADVLHVDADLVGASRFQTTFDEVDIAQPFEHPVMRHGVFAVLPVGEDGHFEPVAQAASDVSFDRSLFLFHVAPHQRVIDPVDRVVEKLSGQPGVGALVFGHDQNAGRVLVDAVDQSGSHVAALEKRQVLQMIGQGIDQRARIVAVAGMDDHAGRLVDDNQVVVFIQNVERNVFGDDFQFAERVGHDDLYPIRGLHLITRLDGRAVHQNVAGVGRRLYAVARNAFHPVGQELVDAQHGLSPVDGHAVMLEQLVLLRFVLAESVLFAFRPVVGIHGHHSLASRVVSSLSAHALAAARASRSEVLCPSSSFFSSRVIESRTVVPSG